MLAIKLVKWTLCNYPFERIDNNVPEYLAVHYPVEVIPDVNLPHYCASLTPTKQNQG